MTERVRLAGISVILPDGWFDVTHDLPEGSPYTLGKADGLGALQFSMAKYRSGTRPRITVQELRGLLYEFGQSHGLVDAVTVREGLGQNIFVVGDFSSENEVIRVWYVSNSDDVALVTYVAQEPINSQVESELQDSEGIVASLDFEQE